MAWLRRFLDIRHLNADLQLLFREVRRISSLPSQCLRPFDLHRSAFASEASLSQTVSLCQALLKNFFKFFFVVLISQSLVAPVLRQRWRLYHNHSFLSTFKITFFWKKVNFFSLIFITVFFVDNLTIAMVLWMAFYLYNKEYIVWVTRKASHQKKFW